MGRILQYGIHRIPLMDCMLLATLAQLLGAYLCHITCAVTHTYNYTFAIAGKNGHCITLLALLSLPLHLYCCHLRYLCNLR